jgi:pimeloyl-ACP methyl ester carboxylesterase
MRRRFLAFALIASTLGLLAFVYPSDPDENHHPVCDGNGNPQGCYAAEDYVQDRRSCDGENRNRCFGTANDGWDTDRMGSRRGLWPQPFEYAVVEYRSDRNPATRWQDQQMDAVVRHIDDIVGSSRSVLLVVFVHGWHHSAREDRQAIQVNGDREDNQDGNLLYFKHLLAKSKHELVTRGDSKRAVLGVYIGWNAGGPDGYLNIGSRARAADRIGNSSDFADDLQRLSAALNPSAATDNRMLVIGHSFGGRILSRYVLRHNAPEAGWQPLGERSLVATINPAIGADAFDGMMQYAADEKAALPAWITLTSKDDSATGNIFTMAASLGRATFVARGITDKVFAASAYSAIGHFRPYQTHRLDFRHVSASNDLCRDTAKCLTVGPYRPGNKPCSLANTPEHLELFRDPPPAGRQTSWYRIPPAAAEARRPLFFLEGTDCSSKFYFTTLSTVSPEGEPLHPVPGRLWNVVTDRAFIDALSPEIGDRATSFARHNAFVQTSLMRMLLELLFAGQPPV